MQKQIFFACGMARSGTTALAKLLGSHSQVVIGVERYKRLWRKGRILQLTPEFFERDRFFNFSDNLTNHVPTAGPQWRDHYALQEAKFDAASHVGDKMTLLRVDEMRSAFPNSKFIVIIRDVYDVAFSWETRARNESDRWPARHDALFAVREWNRNLKLLHGYLTNHPEAVICVEYRKLFGDPKHRDLDKIMAFLGLSITDDGLKAEFARAHQVYMKKVISKPRVFDPEVAEFIGQHANLALWRKLTHRRGSIARQRKRRGQCKNRAKQRQRSLFERLLEVLFRR